MPATRERPPQAFTRRIAVETPEHVVLQLELAGLGSRVAAALLDLVVQVGILLLLVVAVALAGASGFAAALGDVAGGWISALLVVVWFAILWGYFALFEALWGGRTPGKHRLGIRVVMDTGHPVTFGAAAIRNLLRIADAQPFNMYLVGLPFLFFQRHHRRLGDLVAGTIVVYDRPAEGGLAAAAEAAQDIAPPLDLGPPQLSDDEFHLLDRVVSRLDDLDAASRQRLLPPVLERLSARVPWDGRRPEGFLTTLHTDELARRQARSATRTGSDAAKASSSAHRFVALRQAEWSQFHRDAMQIQRGLAGLGGDEIIQFTRRYRAITADLARARTYGVDQRTLEYLERIASAGHNAVYGLRGVRRVPLGQLLLRELPRAVYRQRRLVAAAAAIFFLPGFAGYTLVREQPELATQILPAVMIERAESGAYAIETGRGYAETPSPYLPTVASQIVANNVQVAFGAFALGIAGGVGTVAVLGFNGVFFGAVLGLFANYGIVGWLLTFVAGHGVLELTAIFVAGAAGLLVGSAILLPGDLARRDALVVRGREAIRLVGAAASLLVLAGLIEGFLSASGAPTALKLGVSAASAVLVALYFLAGRGAPAGAGAPPPVTPEERRREPAASP
jgi:uncharacterized membrane protein SpoIIM required for sporulation/uncharacterized RDD family membrane protein YckC